MGDNLKVTHNINLDLQRKSNLPVIYVSQDDNSTRYVCATLYNNSSAWAIPSTAVCSVRFKKPNGTNGEYDTINGETAFSISENNVTVLLAPEMLNVSGDVFASIAFSVDSKILGTFPFVVNVVQNPASGFLESSGGTYLSTFSAVNEAIGDMSELKTEEKSNITGSINEVAVEASKIDFLRNSISSIASVSGSTESLNLLEFEKGSITAGGVDSTYRQDSRARTIGIHMADYDKTIVSANGVEGIVVYLFDDDGNNTSVVDWCAEVKIPAGSRYRLLLSIEPKAGSTVVNELSDILANFYFVNEYEIVKRITQLGENYVALRTESITPYGVRINLNNWESALPNMDDAEPNKIYSVLKTSTVKIANYPDVGSSTFVTFAPESAETFKVQLLFNIENNTALVRTNVSNTWSAWSSLGSGGASTNEATVYVAMNGVDNADGSAADPLGTFNEAIRRGATTIIAEPGTYAQTISVSGVNNLTIRANKKKYDGAFQDGLNPKVILRRHVELDDLLDFGNGVYVSADYYPHPDSRMYKVFISNDLPITDNSDSESVGYNANAFARGASVENDVKLKPVATMSELRSTNNTFSYNPDDDMFYFHCDKLSDGMKVVIPGDDDIIVNIENCDNLALEDIQTEYGITYGINIQNCRNATITACNAHCCTNGEGIRLDYTNAKLTYCKAYHNRNDGFNMHQNGYTELVDCHAKYNGDDGVSHHQGCSGTIIGGEYSYNGSGGITPAFGAEVNVYNAIMRGNNRGLQVIGASDYASRTIVAMNNIMVENNEFGLYVKKNKVVGYNRISGNSMDDIYLDTNGIYDDLSGY